jgi:hypothetical protein
MGSVKKWLRNQAAAIGLALSNVEKTALGQKGKELNAPDVNHEVKVQESDLLQALKKGEVNQEVRNLRWRLYKTIQASMGMTSSIVGYTKNEEGDIVPIVKTTKVDNKKALRKVKSDTSDDYPVDLVIDCSSVTKNIHELLDELESDEVDATKFHSVNKGESPIEVIRRDQPQFEIEKFTKKLVIKSMNNDTKLLEFYVSKYPDINVRTTRLFLSEVMKVMNDGKRSSMLSIDGVNFITYNAIGVDDFLEYSYVITGFNKITEYDGNYVIKFLGSVDINGVNILDKYREEELDRKYDNKEPRKHTI